LSNGKLTVTIVRFKGKILKNSFEKAAWVDQSLVCGIDEVGRGCLAGPLVTAAAILPLNRTSPLLKDSKLMTHEERLTAARWIKKHCVFSYGIVHHRLIDQQNIYGATLIAMKRALVHLLANVSQLPSAILVDAMPLNLADTAFHAIPVYHFPFGERRSQSIAAASILAKLKRDEMMGMLDSVFPGYHFGQHKGYGTPQHKEALAFNSSAIIHRKTFISRLEKINNDAKIGQQSLFDGPEINGLIQQPEEGI